MLEGENLGKRVSAVFAGAKLVSFPTGDHLVNLVYKRNGYDSPLNLCAGHTIDMENVHG